MCSWQVMGAPVAGSNVRASVLTGGGLRMKGLQPRLRSRRVQMIFPLTGSERRGLVSLEAKKIKVMPEGATESQGRGCRKDAIAGDFTGSL